MTQHVLLLRASPDNSDSDEYHLQLSYQGYTPRSISPLETELRNIDQLADVISNSSLDGKDRQVHSGFDGVIITSSRSVEAWTAATKSTHFNRENFLQKWKKASFYVVGSKSASLLERALSGDFRPNEVRILGESESGNSEKLAEYILRSIDDRNQRLLYLTGDKNRDTLPNRLNESDGKISLTTIMVYATCENSELAKKVEQYGNGLRSDPYPEPTGVPNIFVVFFAPSSSAYALPYLKRQFRLPFMKPDPYGIEEEDGDFERLRAIPVAIGPTTATYLRDEVGLHLEIVCKKPEAGALVIAIENYRLHR